MFAHDYKYTDRDVREDPDLVKLVSEYLHQYGGDFEFLTSAKRALAAYGALPTGIVRGVLNCMRTDPKWNVPMPTPSSVPTPLVVLPPPGLFLVNNTRRYRIRLNATFKYPYLMSMWKTAYLVHLLDPRKSVLWYMTRDNSYEAELASWCCLSWSHRRNLVMATEIPEGRIVCRRCTANQEAYS